MPSINKCIVFLALALSASALGTSGHHARAHQGLVRHIQRSPSPEMDMIAPNPLKKRQTSRSNTARCKASEAQASSASVSSASVASASSKSAAASQSSAAAAAASSSESSEKAKASSEAAAAQSSSSSSTHKSSPAKTTKSPQPTPASSNSDNSGLTTGGVGTYYMQDGEAGDCGSYHSDNDIICALQTQTYAGGSNCGKMVQITNDLNHVTVTVLVADECPTCDNPQSIDLSQGAFKALGGTVDEGQFPISWKFV